MDVITPSPNGWLCLHSTADTAEASHIALSLDNRGLAYGDGFFTTMGVFDGDISWLDYHHQRIISHANALQLTLDSHSLLTALKVHAQRLQQGMLKLIVTRATQDIRGYGYTFSECGSACEIWLKVSPMTVVTDKKLRLADGPLIPVQPTGAAICLSSQIACLPPPLAGLKSLNRLDTVLASAELQRIKANLVKVKSSDSQAALDIGEGLVRDMNGCWIEGTMSNVFYQLAEESSYLQASKPDVSELCSLKPPNLNDNTLDYLTTGQWYTPSMAQSGVAGVMRQVIIDALSDTENPIIIRSLQDEDLSKIKRLFFCNALRGMMPMRSLTLLTGEVVRF